MPAAREILWQRQLYVAATVLHQRLCHHQPLHAALGRDPLAARHVAVADVGLERQAQPAGLLRGKDERPPPMVVEDLVGPLTLAMHLVVVDHTADACLLEGLEVGRDALAGGLRLTEEPPHLRAGRVLRMVETIDQR